MNQTRGYACGVLALLLSAQASAPAHADFHADSAAVFGAWKWVRTYGGLLGANNTPPSTGWSRTLFIRRDGTYAFWEQDSVANYVLCSGEITIHPSKHSSIEGGPKASLWVDLTGWWDDFEKRLLVAFLGRDGMLTYPGSEGGGSIMVVSDALKSEFVRTTEQPEPKGVLLADTRPPRLLRSFSNSYRVDLALALWKLLWSSGPLYEWQDGQYPPAVLNSYTYTNDQIPSAVVGEFDGDSLADVAIYGSTTGDWSESKVMCLVSNRGKPRAVEVLREPTLRDPPSGPDTTGRAFREPHPALYLSLIHAGQPLQGEDHKSWILRTDAILVKRLSGEAAAYYFVDDGLRKGRLLTER